MIYVYVYAYLFMAMFLYGWLTRTFDSWKEVKALLWPIILPFVFGKSVASLLYSVIR